MLILIFYSRNNVFRVLNVDLDGDLWLLSCPSKTMILKAVLLYRWDMFPGISVSEKCKGPCPLQLAPSGSPSSTRLDLSPAPQSSNIDKLIVRGDESPTGPLSVDMSDDGTSRSGTLNSNADDELARTFDLRDLESAE